MANTTFDGPVRSKNGFQSIGPGAVPALTLATDLTVKDHAGRLVTMDPAGTPTAITIPAINASADSAVAGPGSDPNNPSTIGTTFEILFTDDFTGTIKTKDTNDKFVGMVTLGIDASVSGKQFVPATANNEVNLNGEAGAAVATTGGLKGSYIKFTAVAANLCDVSLGTDTGGSIRQPASFTGVYGLKPTYGRVSRYGLTAFASSFDSIGTFAKNIDDTAKVLAVISGYDKKDSTSVNSPVPNYLSEFDNEKHYRIGIPKEYFGEGLNSEVRLQIENQIEKFKSDGHKIVEISLPHTEYSIAAYYVLTTAEASSNLARFDGARYGFRADDSSNLNNMYINSRSEGFGSEVKRRIMLGTFVLSSGYYDAYYGKAQKVRRLIKNDFDTAFKNVDIILTPTSPTTAFKFGEKSANPLEMYLSDIYTTSVNLAGIPAISIPVGFDKKGLPIGMQLMANMFNENLLLNFSKKLNN